PALPQTQEVERGARVLRYELDETSRQRRVDQLAGSEPAGVLDRVPAVLERDAVDLREQLALGEVERPDRDGAVAERVADRGRGGARRARGQPEAERYQPPGVPRCPGMPRRH